jgi:NADH-quinone oxidoreductase subunit D
MPLTASPTTTPDAPDQEYLWTLNFGPQHPATHTTLRLVLTLDGERVVNSVPHIGYLHSGFEKLGEHLDFNQYVTIVDRMNYLSPLANEISWHHAVEKLLNIELTPRCKYLRTILAELMRLHDHLLNCGTSALDLGGFHRVPVLLRAAGTDLRHRRVWPRASGSTPATPASAASCST